MKRLLLLLAILLIVIGLCGGAKSLVDAKIEDRSGITADANYREYQTYAEDGHLDADGYYKEDVFEAGGALSQLPDGAARVSFSTNSNLKITYYSDPEQKQALRMQERILQPGDAVYACVSVSKNASSSAYHFSGFRLSEIDEDGERVPLKVIEPSEDGLVLRITDEYIGKELALDPLGSYGTKTVLFRSSYFDNAEQEHALVGKWVVNDKPVSGSFAEISPISSYIISYEFDSNEYFFLSSEPECFYSNSEDGIVIFRKREAADETVDYSVQLHQYVNVSLVSNRSRYVSVNNGFEKEIKAGASLEIMRLKYGESLVIVTDSEWKALESCRELVHRSTEVKQQSDQTAYVYTMSVPEKDSVFTFDPSEYSYAHGTLTFLCYGEEVTSKIGLAEGRRITYVQASAEDGYWLPGGDHTITVTTAEDTRKQLENIAFVEKERVTVPLKQPAAGGRIDYYADGVLLQGVEYTGDNGTEITMKFFPWEGWINNYNNGAVYVLSDAAVQSVTIDGRDVCTTAFTESADHKPTLEVVLSKSVGEDMRFAFEASGLDRRDYSYVDGWFRSDYTIISKQQIGTDKGILVTMGNRAIRSGTAVKILVEKTGRDESGKKITHLECRLVDSLTDLLDPIDIYPAGEIGTSSVYYETIKITIGIVDVLKLSLPSQPANAAVTVRSTETSEILHDGDIFERSESVTVTIAAEDGYYVTGTGVKNDVYRTTVKFEKCVAELQKIISEHPIARYLQITLPAQDAYGECTYKHNGKAAAGTVYAKPGDEITLEYTVTNPGYIIDGATGFLGTSIGKNETFASESVKIDASSDGKTLSRDFFSIAVKEVD